jgi:hypothetical protein
VLRVVAGSCVYPVLILAVEELAGRASVLFSRQETDVAERERVARIRLRRRPN